MKKLILLLILASASAFGQYTVLGYYDASVSFITLAHAQAQGIFTGTTRNPSIYPSTYHDPFDDAKLPVELIHYKDCTHWIIFGNANVDSTTSPYFFFAGSGNGSKLEYEHGATDQGKDIAAQFRDSVHANGGKVLIEVQAVNAYQLMGVCHDSTKTQTFCDSVANYVQYRNYDGVDINWETALSGGSTSVSQAQVSRLLRIMRASLTSKVGVSAPFVLTLGPTSSTATTWPVAAVNSYVSWVQLEVNAAGESGYQGGCGYAPIWLTCPVYTGSNPGQYPSLDNTVAGGWGPLAWQAAGYTASKLGVLIGSWGNLYRGGNTIFGCPYTTNVDSGVSELYYCDLARLKANGGTWSRRDTSRAGALYGTIVSTQTGGWPPRNVTAGEKFSYAISDSGNVAEVVKWGKANNFPNFGMFSTANDAQMILHDYLAANFTGGSAPGSPSLASPSNGATGQSSNVTLSWSSSSGATSYELQVSTSAGFGTTVYDQSGLNGTSQAMSGLANGTYYWHVNATNAYGTSSYSTAWTFTVGAAASGTRSPALIVNKTIRH